MHCSETQGNGDSVALVSKESNANTHALLFNLRYQLSDHLS